MEDRILHKTISRRRLVTRLILLFIWLTCLLITWHDSFFWDGVRNDSAIKLGFNTPIIDEIWDMNTVKAFLATALISFILLERQLTYQKLGFLVVTVLAVGGITFYNLSYFFRLPFGGLSLVFLSLYIFSLFLICRFIQDN